MHDNSAIDERLPNRFDFLDRGNPDMPEMPVEEESPLPQTFSPQEKDYSNLPPAYREAARLADEQKNASEPMEIAMRLLKDDGKQIRNNAPRYHTQFNDDNNDSASDYWLNTAPFLEALPDHLNPNHPNYIQPVAHRIKPNIQSIPQMDDEGWQDSIEASEPMDIAMRLLKEMVI